MWQPLSTPAPQALQVMSLLKVEVLKPGGGEGAACGAFREGPREGGGGREGVEGSLSPVNHKSNCTVSDDASGMDLAQTLPGSATTPERRKWWVVFKKAL